jgi:hypothetical protein|tara:strand:+ start:2024 stop:2212 length:189 start_codon:yes stop_codon:yes gene_type:complete
MPTDSNTAHGMSFESWVDYFAASLNFFGIALLFVFAVLLIGVVELGSVVWCWLMGCNHAKEA